ncbi:hypothetical protein BB561_003715 [Smittium simulii]|uniref:Carbohydrate-binding module family 19 domain-containing protein n=1 Tax=Smittium simulii TaxID=133385 RepID=A0A2T9YJW6_9FUNG|nr:hypothetical protein BB561_003715 [Smittium simulii]
MFSIKSILSFFVLLQALLYCTAALNKSKLDLDKRDPAASPNKPGYNYKPRCKNGEKQCNKQQNGYTECVKGNKKFVKCRRNQFCVMLNGPNAMCVAKTGGRRN